MFPSHDPDDAGGSGAQALENLTGTNQADLNKLKNAIRAARGLGPMQAPTQETLVNVNQCALITDLLHRGVSYAQYPFLWQRGNDPYNKAFSGRIYPVQNHNFNPDDLINMCTMPSNVQSFLNNKNIKNSTIVWDLYWVFQDKNGLKEQLITDGTETNGGANYSSMISNLENLGFIDNNSARS